MTDGDRGGINETDADRSATAGIRNLETYIAQARAETAKQAELWTVCPRKLPSLYPHTDEDMERIEITL
ncbi:MAG: hypothetical protein DCF21_14385 [Leptolyngbya sp.]|nr:MAG: hypothetical protein DCF21_14385 [Leptolyngbya sp.]